MLSNQINKSNFIQPFIINNYTAKLLTKLYNIDISKIFFIIFSLLIALILSTIIASLFIKTTSADMTSAIKNLEVINAVSISILSIIISVPLTGLISIPLAFVISRNNSWIGKTIDIISVIPILIPPSITGLALLMTFGRVGILGDILDYFHVEIAFTFTAVVITQIFITLPIFVQIMKNAFLSINKEVIEASVIFGANDKNLLLRIFLPLSVKQIVTALVLCSLRAAGEFGATMMFAGNLSGKTQTLTTAIYTLAQQNTSEALALAVLMIVFFVLPFGLSKFLLK